MLKIVLYYLRFSLSFNKIGCISTIKTNKFGIAILIFAILVLSSIFTIF